ncbi:MAG: zinc ABC transporter substrate-binding protein [Deferribacteraceae bacterium]|nr:zinc ABC transporter substrate-binding protein [Deferribacteraceae bacterium]
MRLIYILFAVCLGISAVSCTNESEVVDDKPLVIVTTGMIADIVRNVGGNFVNVIQLIPSGANPHQYKASEMDIISLAGAHIIFHNGLYLEAKLSKILQRAQNEIPTYAVSSYIPIDKIIFYEKVPDPHIWFDPNLWIYAVKSVADGLISIDPQNTVYYRRNEENYIRELLELDENIKKNIENIPKTRRTVITVHDAFSYFNKAYGWHIIGIHGVHTADNDPPLQPLTKIIADKGITHIFAETSMPSRSVSALIALTAAQGRILRQGAALSTDSLGERNSSTGTYIGMINATIKSIIVEITSYEH